MSLPFAQAGAMATAPRLAGTAAGIGMFAQNFMGAGIAQSYGMPADGSPAPLVQTAAVMATSASSGRCSLAEVCTAIG